jgi:Protein of unknown function (DUF2726)
MTQLWLVAIAVVVLAAILAILKIVLLGGGRTAYPYVRCETLFSAAERSFYGVLLKVIGDRYVVLGKIRLADIIKTRPGLSASECASAQNRISSKHVDFVLCNPQTLAIVAVIELDDKSHASDRRKQRDNFLDGALAAAGIPVLHVRAQKSYSTTEIAGSIAGLVSGTLG